MTTFASVDDGTHRRPTFLDDDSRFGRYIYVDNSVSESGDGTCRNPYASLADAIEDIPLNRSANARIVKIVLKHTSVPYLLPFVDPVIQMDRVDIDAELPSPTWQGSTSSVSSSSVATGGQVAVVNLGEIVAADALRGALVRWVGGTAAGEFGIVYQNDATDETTGFTTVRAAQTRDGSQKSTVGSRWDIYDESDLVRFDLGSGVDGLSLQSSNQFTLRYMSIGGHLAATARKLVAQNAAKLVLEYCLFSRYVDRLTAFEQGAFLELRGCYVAASGSSTKFGMVGIDSGVGSAISLRGGNVFDGINASTPVPLASQEGAIGSITIRGPQYFRACQAAEIGTHTPLGVDQGYRAERCVYVYEHKSGTSVVNIGMYRDVPYQGTRGSHTVPNLYGTVSHDYCLVARGSSVSLGRGSACTTDTFTNAVSMDGGDSSCSGVAYEGTKCINDRDPDVSGWTINTLTPSGTTETVDWADGDFQVVNLSSTTGAVTLTLRQPVVGGVHRLKFIQHASTPRTLTWPSNVVWPGGTQDALTSSNDAVDLYELVFDGTNYIARQIAANVS